MTTQDQHSDVTEPAFVFRVLNGSLNGIEFSLSAQDHFICVNDALAKKANLSFAERTLFIPAAQPGSNFILNLGIHNDDQQFQITICHPEHQENQQLEYNLAHRIEGIVFAIRPEHDAWSEDVLKGLPPPTNTPEAQSDSDTSPTLPAAASKSSKASKGRPMAMLLAVVLVAAIGCAAYFYWSNTPGTPATHAATNAQDIGSVTALSNTFAKFFVSDTTDAVSALIASRPGYSVQPGSNKINYLFASTYQQYDWASQIISKKNLASHWRVVTPQLEEARVATILERNNIAFFTVRFNEPANPTLLLSSTRNVISKENLDFITKLMLHSLPYAKNVHIALEEDSEILNKAEQGLRALGFRFDTQQSESGVTLSSWMPSVDVPLTEFSRFVTQFYQTWGKRYVHFTADIREDLLKEKSYKYGEDGYITMNKSHWLFNNKVE